MSPLVVYKKQNVPYYTPHCHSDRLRRTGSRGRIEFSLDIINFMSNSMSLAFFGSSENSLTVLKSLTSSGLTVRLVVSSPPRPVGRNKILTKTPPQVFAEENGIPVLTPERLDEKFLKAFSNDQVDVAIVADYARLIPKEILDLPKHGCLNLHPSLLPKYRGSSPAEMAILHGDSETGMTILKMDEKFDHGPIVSQFTENIREDDNSETLYKRLFTKGAQVLSTILPAWIEGRIVPREQDHSQATLAPRLTRDDGFIPWFLINKAMEGKSFNPNEFNPRLRLVWIDIKHRGEDNKFSPGATASQAKLEWQASQPQNESQNQTLATKKISVDLASFVERAIRAFHPWPGIWTTVKLPPGRRPSRVGDKTQSSKLKSEKQRLKILSAHLNPKPYPLNPILVLDDVQLEGKRPTTFSHLQHMVA